MNPGIAAGAVWQVPAGEPAVLPVGMVRFVEPNFKPLYEPVLIPNRNKEPTWAGERPFAVVGAKAGNTVQVMPVGAEQVGQKLAAPLSLGHTSVSVFSDAIFG